MNASILTNSSIDNVTLFNDDKLIDNYNLIDDIKSNISNENDIVLKFVLLDV